MNPRLTRIILLLVMIAMFHGCGADDEKESKSESETRAQASNEPPATIINEIDGTKLILIPAGEFIAGGDGSYEGGEYFL